MSTGGAMTKSAKLFAIVAVVLMFCAYAGIARAGVNQWTTNGPYGGDIRATAVSPNYASDQTVFAGTYGGGVFKSADGGATWSAVNTGLTSLLIHSLAISQNYATDQTVYAGTENGYGVFKSINGGASWVAVNSGITRKYIYIR